MSESQTEMGIHLGEGVEVMETRIAPGHWELYRVNEITVDWRYVVDGDEPESAAT